MHCKPQWISCVPSLTITKKTKFYNKILLVGDFNAEYSEPCLSDFLYKHECKNLVKDNTCFNSTKKPQLH